MMDLVCAMGVLTIVVTAILSGESGQLHGVRASFDDLAASRAAAAQLETLTAPDAFVVTGARTFPTRLPGCEGREEVRRVTPGLFEVTVRVVRGERELSRLTTLIATEESR